MIIDVDEDEQIEIDKLFPDPINLEPHEQYVIEFPTDLVSGDNITYDVDFNEAYHKNEGICLPDDFICIT